jgi:hypothetical protein
MDAASADAKTDSSTPVLATTIFYDTTGPVPLSTFMAGAVKSGAKNSMRNRSGVRN